MARCWCSARRSASAATPRWRWRWPSAAANSASASRRPRRRPSSRRGARQQTDRQARHPRHEPRPQQARVVATETPVVLGQAQREEGARVELESQGFAALAREVLAVARLGGPQPVGHLNGERRGAAQIEPEAAPAAEIGTGIGAPVDEEEIVARLLLDDRLE